MLHALLLLACGSPSGEPDDTADTGGGASNGLIATVLAERSSQIATVTRVTWTTSRPTVGRVRFGEGDGLDLATPLESEPALEHEALLIGLPENTEGSFQVEVEDTEGEEARSEVLALETGSLAAEVPRPLAVTLDSSRVEPGLTLVPVGFDFDKVRWGLLLDSQGRTVWAAPLGPATHRMHPSPDGRGIVTYIEEDLDVSNPSFETFRLVDMAFDGQIRWELEVAGGRQDFAVVDEDTFLVMARDVREVTLAEGPNMVMGDRLVEVGRDGSVRQVWSVWDELGPDASVSVDDMVLFDGFLDWSHGSSLYYDPATDQAWISLRNRDAVVAIDRQTGALTRVLAETFGDYTHEDGISIVDAPHSVQPIDGGVLIFNQGNIDGNRCAAAMRIALDDALGQATPTWRYESDGCYPLGYMGNAQALDGGGTLVSFSQRGFADEVGADDGLATRLELPVGATFFFIERQPADWQPW